MTDDPLPRESLRLAIVQMCSTDDRDANVRRAVQWIERAADDGARVVLLPENVAYLDREGLKIHVAERPDDGPICRAMSDTAARCGLVVVAGSIPLVTDDPGRTTNTLLAWDERGRLVARYDKIHLFDIDLDEAHAFRESRHVTPGREVVTLDVDRWRLGLSICYDLRFPELYRSLVDRGAHALLVPAAFTARTGRDHWEVLLRARAIENQCWTVAAAQWGRHNPARESWGRSMVIDPWGDVVARIDTGEGYRVADLDPGRLAAVRRALPALSHRRLGR